MGELCRYGEKRLSQKEAESDLSTAEKGWSLQTLLRGTQGHRDKSMFPKRHLKSNKYISLTLDQMVLFLETPQSRMSKMIIRPYLLRAKMIHNLRFLALSSLPQT